MWGWPTSTVRFYERIGLLESPTRTGSGYRDYDDDAATRLQFVHRARRIGLSCEQIAELLPVWGGADCSAAHDRVQRLLDEKQAEVTRRIDELEEFARQLRAAGQASMRRRRRRHAERTCRAASRPTTWRPCHSSS